MARRDSAAQIAIAPCLGYLVFVGKILDFCARRPPIVRVLLLVGHRSRAKTRFVRRLADDPTIAYADARALAQGPGCGTCSLREKLGEFLEGLTLAPGKKYLLLEAPEDVESYPLSFLFGETDGETLGRFRLDRIVSLVDAVRLWSFLTSSTALGQVGAVPEGTVWPQDGSEEALDAILGHIECCDALVVLGSKQLGDREREALDRLLPWLQPRASLLRDEDILEPLASVLGSPGFSGPETRDSATVRALPRRYEEPFEQPSELAGDYAFLYRRRRPMHPLRFASLLERWPEGAVRSAGVVWLATQNEVAYSLSQFGPASLTLAPEGYWLATLSPSEVDAALVMQPQAKRHWDPKFGDRCTELVFLGDSSLRKVVVEGLDDCLLTDWEMHQDWSLFPDPFLQDDDEENSDRPPLRLVPPPEVEV